MTQEPPFAHIRAVAEELRSSAEYRYENLWRRDPPDALVVQRTLSGFGFFQKGAQRELVGAGQAMLFSHAEDTSYGYPPEMEQPYCLQFICFYPGSLGPLFSHLRSHYGSVIRMPDRSESASLFDEIMSCYQQRKFRDRLEECDLLHRLILAIYRDQIQQSSDPIEFGWHYIHSHFRANVNLKTIAQECGVSREHFSRRFSERYGEAPGCLLRRFRLEHARVMLLSTQLSVQDVALASGFTSSNAFCRAYRHAYGASPSQAREI